MPGGLTPPAISARAEPRTVLPFSFGSRFFFVLLVGFLWIIPAWWSPTSIAIVFAWDVLALVLFGIDLVRLPRPKALELTRAWSAPLTLMQPTRVRITIANSSRIPVKASILDHLPLTLRDEPAAMTAVVPPVNAFSHEYVALPRERGDVRAGKLFIRYRSVLGFAERWAIAPLEQTVTVLPDLPTANEQALYVLRTRHSGLEKQKRRYAGFGREFETLREYRDGDELRDVSWSATARRGQLVTKTYSAERSQTVWIVVDAGRLLRARVRDGDSDLAKLDYSVNAAVSLARVALLQGDRVGLLTYGRSIQQIVAASRGASHLRAMVDALAHVRGEPQEADHARAVRTLGQKQTRRALIVWITDFAETPGTPDIIENVSMVSGKHLVLLAAIGQPDLATMAREIPQSEENMFRQAAALELMERREMLLRQLRERGVLAFELAPGRVTAALVNEYLRVKDRSLL